MLVLKTILLWVSTLVLINICVRLGGNGNALALALILLSVCYLIVRG